MGLEPTEAASSGSSSDAAAAPLPRHAGTVIIGGGIVGCSTAYHLAKLGEKDVLLLERSKLTSGTTWHSAAQVRQLRSTVSLTQLARYSAKLYAELAEETGQETGWRQCGSLSIATNPDRLLHIRRQASLANVFDIDVHDVDRAEMERLWPIMETSDVIGAIYSPSDGRVNPSDLCAALTRSARAGGVRIFEDTPVTGIRSANGRVSGVDTIHGPVDCDRVVVCAGLWSRDVGLMAGVSVPLHACEHFYLLTKPFEGTDPMMPTLGDHDGFLYVREEVGGLLVGCFEPDPKPIAVADLPRGFSFDLLGEDWDHFEPMMLNAIHRIPALERVEARMLLNGPESFTPDNNFLLGEAPELGGFFLGCGMNSVGVASGGGAGRALAEWIVAGEPSMDLWTVDVRRFGRYRNNVRALRSRIAETLSLHYAIAYPGREPMTARNARLTPLHERLAARGAQFGDRAGWERPSFFLRDGRAPATQLRFGRPDWFEAVGEEHRAARETVALFDQSTFAKLLIQGRDAAAFLQRMCANDVDVEPGQLVYTPLLNARGGYESDVVLQRIDAQRFMLITGAAQAVRDASWLERHRGEDEFVTLTDVTSGYAVLGVMGPRSRQLLSRLTSADLDNEAFPYLTHREIEIGRTLARAARISFVGELGWELSVPSDAALMLYDDIVAAGADLDLRDAGTNATGSLRLEKGYCSWGHDIGPDDSPLRAGMGFTTRPDKATAFIGRDALVAEKSSKLASRRVLLTADDPETTLYGGEPIYVDGEISGHTTSIAHGYTIGRAIGMGYVRLAGRAPRALIEEARFELEIAGRREPATASLRAFYDPDGQRLRM